jgi:hypothetical protein
MADVAHTARTAYPTPERRSYANGQIQRSYMIKDRGIQEEAAILVESNSVEIATTRFHASEVLGTFADYFLQPV